MRDRQKTLALLSLALLFLRESARLLALVARNSARDAVELASEAVRGPLGVLLGLRDLVLGLARGVLLLPLLREGGAAGEVADGLFGAADGDVPVGVRLWARRRVRSAQPRAPRTG